MLPFCKELFVGFLRKEFYEGLFVLPKISWQPAQFQGHHLVDGVLPDVVPLRARTPVIALVIGAAEEPDVPGCVQMEPQLPAAVGAVEQVREPLYL